MLPNIRWRIALWFVGLSTAVYIVPTLLALVVFYLNLTASLDSELNEFTASFGHAISVDNGKPILRDWARTVQTVPPHSLVSYQLFDAQGKLLETHGEPGIPELFKAQHEVRRNGISMRTQMTPLKSGQELVGYLQLQLPTKTRDDAITQLAMFTAIVAPVVLLGLGWASYLVSEKATVSIRETNTRLRQFIADASHELYTPLSVVQAAIESLQQSLPKQQPPPDEFEIAENTLDRMEAMLEDLLFLSTVENPTFKASPEKLSVRQLVNEVVREFTPKFEQKGVAITYGAEPDTDGIAMCDRLALHRMFSNIIENALRYTPAGGSVSIGFERDGNCLCIAISDTGIGIPAASLSMIFDRFYRVDASRSRSSGGSGLGLAIAKAIAQAHDGDILVESEMNKGTTFTLVLPASFPARVG